MVTGVGYGLPGAVVGVEEERRMVGLEEERDRSRVAGGERFFLILYDK